MSVRGSGMTVKKEAGLPVNENKRQPLLADLASRAILPIYQGNITERIRGKIKGAHRYLLTDDAVRHIANMVRTIPELIAEHQQFARAPHDLTWIEFDWKSFWETANQKTLERDAPDITGFLIDHNTVYVVSNFKGRGMISPYVYHLHTPHEGSAIAMDNGKGEISYKETPELIDRFFWASQYDRVSDRHKSMLRSAHSVSALPLLKRVPHEHLSQLYQEMILQGAGDLRNIITMLLVINRPAITRYIRTVDHARQFVRGKLTTYMSHTVVTIHADPTPQMRALGGGVGGGEERRRHKVRGHWCNNFTAREYGGIGCIHEWHPDPDHVDRDDPADPDHFVCSACAGKRWWREDHMRGNAGIGYVDKHYVVT